MNRTEQMVRNAMDTCAQPMLPRHIIELLGLPKSTVYNAITRLYERGEVERVVSPGHHSKYFLSKRWSRCEACGGTGLVVKQDTTTCPDCGGPADRGHSRDVPPAPYVCSKCDPDEDGRRP